MASSDVFSAIERIRTDEGFARKVAAEGAPALGSFHLTSDEQTAIVLAFQHDLEEGFGGDELDEVVGFASLNFGGLQLNNLIAVQRNMGGSDTVLSGGQSGWDAGWIEDEVNRGGFGQA